MPRCRSSPLFVFGGGNMDDIEKLSEFLYYKYYLPRCKQNGFLSKAISVDDIRRILCFAKRCRAFHFVEAKKYFGKHKARTVISLLYDAKILERVCVAKRSNGSAVRTHVTLFNEPVYEEFVRELNGGGRK